MASIRSEQALQDINEQLQRIQCILQDVSSCLVTPDDDATPEHLRSTSVESWIRAGPNGNPFLLTAAASCFA